MKQTMHALKAEQLAPLLDRRRQIRRGESIPVIALDRMLAEILEKANEFVPSDSGSVLIDNPHHKLTSKSPRDLVFACCFGSQSKNIVGQTISSDTGIVGKVYHEGVSLLTNDAPSVASFNNAYDSKFNHKSKTVLCVPIFVGSSICGVIELINKLDGKPYTDSERELLEIFAGYISSSFQNVLDTRQIERMVHTDNLTGLNNDRYLHDKLKEELKTHLKTGEPFTIIFLDLDHFKKINDTHGHLAGSAVLAEYGDVLRETVSHPGATMVRYGGDEFALLFPKCSQGQGEKIGEAIRSQTEKRIFLAGPWGSGQPPLHLSKWITASVGVCTLTMTDNSDKQLIDPLVMKFLSQVDKAMYDAKAKGKNRVASVTFAE